MEESFLRSTLALVASCLVTVNAVLHSSSKDREGVLPLDKSNNQTSSGRVLGILFLIFVALMLWYEYTQPDLIAGNNLFGVNLGEAHNGGDEDEDEQNHAVLMTQE
jgi:hypothetical protein